MVRIIAGTLIDIGRGKIQAEDIPKIIDYKDRKFAGHTAAAEGLYLERYIIKIGLDIDIYLY